MTRLVTPVNVGAREDTTFSANIVITNSAGQVWAGGAVPDGLTIDPTTGAVDADLSANNPAYSNPPITMAVTITATNPGGSSSTVANIILQASTVPVLRAVPDQLALAQDNSIYQISLEVLAGEGLTFSASNLPSGWSINSRSGEILAILSSPVARRTVTVQATNQYGTSEPVSFDVAVAPSQVGASVSPVLTSGARLAFPSSDALVWPQKITPNLLVGTAPLTWDIVSSPSGQDWSVDSATGVITVPRPTAATKASGDLVVRASNAAGTDESRVYINTNTSAYDVRNWAGIGALPTGWNRSSGSSQVDFRRTPLGATVPGQTGSDWGANYIYGPVWNSSRELSITTIEGPLAETGAVGLVGDREYTSWATSRSRKSLLRTRNGLVVRPGYVIGYSPASPGHQVTTVFRKGNTNMKVTITNDTTGERLLFQSIPSAFPTMAGSRPLVDAKETGVILVSYRN